MSTLAHKKPLGLLSLTMMAIISVDSLRNVPIAAQYGLSLVSFYLIAALFFFFPLAWISARLAASFPKAGGSYAWISQAFGHRWGTLALSLQWINNIIWYPTIFVFITVSLAHLLLPEWTHNKIFILGASLVLFWLITALHCFGVRVSAWISIGSALIGTVIPMVFIIGFAAYWLLSGHPSASALTWHALLPASLGSSNLAYFSNILFSLMGLDLIAMYAGQVNNPTRDFPKALAFSSVFILVSLIGSSLALCIIIPCSKIALIDGLMETLDVFFLGNKYSFAYALMGGSIIIGGLGIASSWMIGLARGLHAALSQMNAPALFQRINAQGVPANLMLIQALIFSLLLIPFIGLASMSRAYWILSAITAQFALVYYIIFFLAAMALFRKQDRGLGFWQRLAAISACLISLIGMIAAFIPPVLST